MSEEGGNLPERYRMTELGPLPEEWKVVALGHLVRKAKAGGTPHRSDPRYWGGDVPFVLIEDMTACGLYLSETRETITRLGLHNSSAWIVPTGSVLVSMYASIGVARINTIPVATNQAIIALIPGEQLDAVFAAFMMNFNADRLATANVQSTQKNVNKGIVLTFEVSVPPLPEQKKIAVVLSVVQEGKERTEAVIAAAKELKKSLMKYLFTYGPVPVDEAENVRLKETEIGEMPEGWPVRRLAEVCKVKTSTIEIGRLGEVDSGASTDVLVHGIKVADMNTPGNEREIKRAGIEVRVPERIAARQTVPAASVVFPKRGAAIATNKKRLTTTWTALDPNLIAVSPSADLNPDFLHAWFLTFDIASIQSPGPTPQLNKKDVEPVELPVPQLNLQREVASAIARVDAKIEAEEDRKRALEELFRTLLNELMTAKIRVNDIEVSPRPLMPMDSG